MARRLMLLAVVGALGLAVLVSPGLGAKGLDPGVTKTSIHIGATYPITGAVGSVYGTITRAVAAYNANFKASGQKVNGRNVNVTYIDDAYDPSKTVAGTKQLVEQQKVFAIVGSLGTAPNLAIQKYLNSKKVPQVLIATGDAFWSLPCATPKADGTLPNNVPTSCPATKQMTGHYWTFGGLATYTGEAKLMAGYIAQKAKGAKVGVVYQNDAYGTPYLAALRKYLGKNGTVIAQPYDATKTDVSQQVVALHRAGADILYNMALPLQSVSALVTAAKIGWKPKITIVNAVAASAPFMQGAAKQGADINGAISSGIGPNPDDPANAGLPIIKQYKAIMKKYFTLAAGQTIDAAIADQNNYAGMGGAWLTNEVLKQAGNPPTRVGLMNALTHLDITNDPYLYHGYRIHTTPTDRFLYSESKLVKWQGGDTGFFRPFGNLVGNLKG
jgi:branched-chain amino acid transport system substrate-binding protein